MYVLLVQILQTWIYQCHYRGLKTDNSEIRLFLLVSKEPEIYREAAVTHDTTAYI